MGKLLTEAIGTFFLVLTIGLTVVPGNPLAALAIGSALMVMVYMGGHISGAHYNPAVTLAIWLRGRFDRRLVAPYMIAQLAGSLLGSLAVLAITGDTFAPRPAPGATLLAVLLVELLFTFALALVVLQVATAKATEGNSYYGLAIGFTVLAGALAAGSISGGAFNPAVATGPSLVDAIVSGRSLTHLGLYLLAQFAAAGAAAFVFSLQDRSAAATS